jgi:tetratricopeptide (TPR) repeat protein
VAYGQQNDSSKVSMAEGMIVDQDFTGAFEIYQELLKDNPMNYDYRLRVGLLLGWMKRFDDSEDHFQQMLIDYPNNIEIGTALMRVLSWQHRYAESIELSKEFEKLYPDNKDLLLITAQTYFWSGAYPDSEKYTRKLLEIDPENDVVLSLNKDLLIVQAPWVDGGTVWGWDSEDTQLIVIGVRGQIEITDKTRFQLGIDRFDTKNDRILRVGDAYSLSGTFLYNVDHIWRLRGDLGLASYQQKISNRGDLFFSGGLNLRRNTGKHTTNYTVSHNPILESPILMENRIQMTSALIAYRYRHLNYSFFATPQLSWYSDGNNRQSVLLEFNYSTEGEKFRARPGIKAQYIAFDSVVIDNGYFSPEQLTTLLATVELDRSEPGGEYQFLLAGDIGYQKIDHPVVDSDPKLLYRVDLRFVWSPGDDFRLSAGYEYTNLQTVSALSTSSDYWYQAANVRLRYQFN